MAIAYRVYVVGLSFDKVCLLMNFFQNLTLRKSQADALLKRLAKQWESEFDILCTLIAHSAVVHTDETSWSINSAWAFPSEKARLMFFGVHKDAATLQQILDPATFAGIVVSDDAAVYANFTHAQKCWAHLLRKAIKLTLLESDNAEYREFTDRPLAIYRTACRVQRDRRFSDAGRARKVAELDEEIADARKTGRTSKTPAGARRRTVIVSVLESLRQHLRVFTLPTIIAEVLHWTTAGRSCFARLLAKLKLPPSRSSPLNLIPAAG